jgi:hypothetical protein
MDGHFLETIRTLEPSFQRLLAMTPVTPVTLPRSMPKSGIYLFSENGRDLYVGRTRNIRARIAGHSRPGAKHGTAAFAFQLAREATGNLAATYKKKGSRADLMESPEFRLAFDEAKKRIRAMELRFVEEDDPIRQAVLEIYVAVSLKTPYNDFDTH